MSADLTGIAIDGYRIDPLKEYCRKGYVIAERIPKVYGFSIRVTWKRWYKPFYFKYSVKNIIWVHFSFQKEYCHKTGNIVYRPPEK
jgi:hypothetical protein